MFHFWSNSEWSASRWDAQHDAITKLVSSIFFILFNKLLLQVDDEVGLPFLEPVSGGRGGGAGAICNWSWFDVSRAVWLGGQGGGGGTIWKTKQFDHFWLGGRGGGEEEVVKNQAVISISYQVWENVLGYFRLHRTFFLGLAGDERCFGDKRGSHCAPGGSSAQVIQ